MGQRLNASVLSLNDGVSSYGTITTIGESPLNPQLLYVGTDDGNVQVTRDGGATWTDVTGRIRGLPDRTYVSRVVPSAHAEGTVFATFDGHYDDDYRPYVYVSEDYGQRWQAIVAGLPNWSVNVVAEHPRTAGLLFLGNEIGAYVSIDRGAHWTRLDGNLPTVPVDDIKIHPRDNDLVLGTHGRSVWILENVSVLEEMVAAQGAAARVFTPARATTINTYSPQGWNPGTYAAPDAPYGALMRYYLRDGVPASGDDESKVTIEVVDGTGASVTHLEGPGTAGIHEVRWDLRYAPPVEPREGEGGGFLGTPRGPKVLPGTYEARLTVAEQVYTANVEVRGDPRIAISVEDLAVRQEALRALNALAGPLSEAVRAAQNLNEQLGEVVDLLRAHEEAPEALEDEATELRQEVGRLVRELGSARSGALRAFSGLDGVTARPTEDQLWHVDDAWNQATALLPQLNTLITEGMPALYRQLDEHGIRPDPGAPVEVPRRPGR